MAQRGSVVLRDWRRVDAGNPGLYSELPRLMARVVQPGVAFGSRSMGRFSMREYRQEA